MTHYHLQASMHASYRAEIDGLRAVAVILVIINHFNELILPSGFLGVDIFFVISGYVVTASLVSRSDSSIASFLVGFYVRRIKRIIPALIVCVSITAVIGCFFIQYPESTLTAGKYALFGTSNIFFFQQSIAYFGDAIRHNLFMHTWSLGVEEQYYLVFPLLLALTYKRRMENQSPNLVISALALLSTLSLILWVQTSKSLPHFSYFMLPTRFWEIGMGSLAFLLAGCRYLDFGKFRSLVSAFSVLCILAIPFFSRDYIAFTSVGICIATALFILTAREGGTAKEILSTKVAVTLGILSYSLYLWHWPIISLSFHTIGINWYTVPIQIFAMTALAALSYRFVEKPIRFARAFRSQRIVILAGVAALACCYLWLAWLSKPPNALFSANMPRFDITRPIFTASPSFEQCTHDYDGFAEFPPRCYYQAKPTSRKTLWLIGDSTTWALKGFASAVSKELGVNVVMFADDSAIPSTTILRANENSRWEKQRKYFTQLFPYIERWGKAEDIVLITANVAYYFCRAPELFCSPEDEASGWKTVDGKLLGQDDALEAFLTEITTWSASYDKRGIRTLVSAPLPRWSVDHRVWCERQWFRPKWETEKCNTPNFSDQEQSRSRILNSLSIAEKNSQFTLYDPFQFFCSPESCTFSDPATNQNYWIDQTHLSTYGGEKLAPHFVSFLKSSGLIRSY